MSIQVLELKKCGVQLEQCQLVRYNEKNGTMRKLFDEPKVREREWCVSSLDPRPSPSFPSLYRTASGRKLGKGLGTRLVCVYMHECVCLYVYVCVYVHACVWDMYNYQFLLPSKECLQLTLSISH